MKKNVINRREMLGSIAALGATATLGLTQVKTAALNMTTPPLTQAEMTAIETAMGKKGKYVEAENTYTVPLPRNDLKVTVKGESVPISFGFGGWVSVKKTMDGKSAVLMSDTVLLEEEVNPLVSAAHANGLEISAIHNHFFYEQPRIFYMHLHGMGTVADLAKSYAATIKNNKLFPANQPSVTAPTRTAKEIFDLPALDKIVGKTGAAGGATYKYTVGRDDVVAVHNHMLGENPRTIFLHYYGRGAATRLATGFRAALNELGKKHGAMQM